MTLKIRQQKNLNPEQEGPVVFQNFPRARYWLLVDLCSHIVFSVIPVKLGVVNSAYFQQESTETHFIRRNSKRGGSVEGAF